MHKLNSKIILFAGILCAFLYVSCDETPGNALDESDQPQVVSLDISPQQVNFLRTDGIKDTTVSLRIESFVSGLEDGELPSYAIFDVNNSTNPEFEGQLQDWRACTDMIPPSCDDHYGIDLNLELNTLDFKSYQIFVYATNSSSPNWISTSFEVSGFPNAAPDILEVNNAAEVPIPTDDTIIVIPFTAKVTDEDGQETIREVRILFQNEDGSILTPNPNQLLDDGNSESGDFAAGDSVFTITFQIDRNNSPNNRMALYYAIDNAGLSSDTLKLPFNLINN